MINKNNREYEHFIAIKEHLQNCLEDEKVKFRRLASSDIYILLKIIPDVTESRQGQYIAVYRNEKSVEFACEVVEFDKMFIRYEPNEV